MQTKPSKRFGWFGLLTIAVISGLIVRVVGDPLVQIISPKIEDAAEDAADFLEDQDLGEKLNHWLEQQLEERFQSSTRSSLLARILSASRNDRDHC